VGLPITEPASIGINECAVSAQDFTCLCSVEGIVSVILRVNGENL
jgi:hypothetical protein